MVCQLNTNHVLIAKSYPLRHKQLFNKLRGSDVKNKWGSHYKFNEEEFRNDWNKTRKALKSCVVTNWDKSIRSHLPKNKRWWRLKKNHNFLSFGVKI